MQIKGFRSSDVPVKDAAGNALSKEAEKLPIELFLFYSK